MKKLIITLFVFSVSYTSLACIKDLGSYEDSYGYTWFRFQNSCYDQSHYVTICQKTSGPYGITYNPYTLTIEAGSTGEVQGGKYHNDYRWYEDGQVYCPYE